jgi:predicted permease
MRLYRLLLRLYPASFRAEYGSELIAAFAARRSDAGSPFARLMLWSEVLPDLILTAALSHWDILRQDVRLAARSLRRSPGFTITTILVAAIGIGANTAVFSVTDHVLVRPLPFVDAGRLVQVWEDYSSRGYPQSEASPANWRDWRRQNRSFETLAAYTFASMNLIGGGAPERVETARMSADMLPMLGVQPALGRWFAPNEEKPGAPGTLILSDSLWKMRFGADPAVIGRNLVLDGTSFTVIGIMPASFSFPNRDIRIWIPLQLEEQSFEDRGDLFLYGVGRLRPGVTIDMARAEMRTIAKGLARIYPENQNASVTIVRLRDQVSTRARLMLLALMMAAAGVLLIACTNLANLLLARALVRRKELALRTALGAGRERLVRQLLTESLLLASIGGVLGVWLAMTGAPLLTRLVPTTLPITQVPPLDLRVMLLGALVTMLTGIGFGVLPAMRACGGLEAAALQEGSRGGVGGRREKLRHALVIAAVAVSVMLSIGSGLLIRALWRVQSTPTGFRPEGVVTLRTWLPLPKYDPVVRRMAFYNRVLDDIRALPGVKSAAYISFLPMTVRGGVFTVRVEGRPSRPNEQETASLRFVTPGFFDTIGTPLKRGRDVSNSDVYSDDANNTMFAAVISESFARQYFPGQDPIGRRFNFAFRNRTVVGIVGNIKVRGLEANSEPQVYLPASQGPNGGVPRYSPKDLVIRTSATTDEDTTAAAAALMPAVRAIIARADPEQPISDVRTLSDIVAADTAPRVTQVRVLGVFAGIAFLLAGIGIHGLLSFAVSHRAPEIGVRMAMGARRRDILGMVLGEGLTLAIIGVIAGVALAYAAGRSLEALLAGITPWDLPTFATGIAVSLAMTIVGSLLPALRAVRVDPLVVMRSE